VNVEKHLTDDAPIALASNQIPESLRKEAVDHLAECEICRTKHRQIRSIYSVVRYANANGMLSPEETSHPQLDLGRLQHIFPWRAIGGIAVGVVAVLAITIGLHTEPKVDAAVLVDRALANEHSAGAASSYTIQMRGTRCGAGDRGVMKVAALPLCQKATSQIIGTSWASGNPLSAAKFKEWRSSLHNFRDKVEKQPDGWMIETSTSQGPVRQAKFSLRSDTYHPFELDIELATMKNSPSSRP
jgi:hypothetical protein